MHSPYQLLADAVLLSHTLFAASVVAGLLLTVIGGRRGWEWVRNPWFRIAHLVGIGVVAAQAWAGLICPLTTLEMWLRRQTGETSYQGSFIQHWLQRLLYVDAPLWAFAVAYTLFGALVVAAWVWYPPRFGSTRAGGHSIFGRFRDRARDAAES